MIARKEQTLFFPPQEFKECFAHCDFQDNEDQYKNAYKINPKYQNNNNDLHFNIKFIFHAAIS